MNTNLNQENDTLFFGDESDITEHVSSLRYAGMIQRALMPDAEIIKKYLKDYFVLFLPRDIVSGDFYYTFSDKKRLCIAAGDCTGHGVPGALLSILGISFLNEVLQSCISFKPNKILNILREKVMKALNQKGDDSLTKDSIDIALCMIDISSGTLDFSGANRPLFMVRDGELIEYKGDNMTIGIAPVREKSFTNYSINLLEGDSFYIFSDGYCDQFGGVEDKKFKYYRFRQIIKSLQGMSMNRQRDVLESSFREWQGSLPQVDDVTVIGFKF